MSRGGRTGGGGGGVLQGNHTPNPGHHFLVAQMDGWDRWMDGGRGRRREGQMWREGGAKGREEGGRGGWMVGWWGMNGA